jgi:carboxyl-terminal processing protease
MTDEHTTSSQPEPPAADPQPAEPLRAEEPATPAAHRAGPIGPVAWVISLALAAVVGALLFVGGYLAAGASGTGCAAPDEAFAAFCQAYRQLKDEYVDDLDDEALAEGAIQGMFEYGVQDPFSGYMSPDAYRRALSDLQGEFSGIGAEMGVRNTEEPEDLESCTQFSDICRLVVVAPLEGSPAEEAGLRAGDFVTAIDGTSVNGMDLSDAVNEVRGETGTDVTLTLLRDGQALDLTITRDKIQLREVTSEMLDDDIGYVALHGFSDASAEQFRTSVGELVDAGAAGIIFDLRDNPGGYIEAARKVASEFIADGLIFSQESAGDEVKEWEATGDGLATDPDLPLVVLINGGSASASEIVAGALQDRGRATIIGQHSYGKNTVQVWTQLTNNGGVRITISRWFTPDHRSVAPDGVQPDVVVEVPDGTPPERDLYIERAMQFLTSRALGNGESPSPAPASSAGESPSAAAPLVPALSPVSYDPRGMLRATA